MASILAGDIRKGSTFEYNGKGVYTVTEFQHVKPGKGAAFVRATLKNVVTGQVLSAGRRISSSACAARSWAWWGAWW